MELNIVRADPAGNITVFVLNPPGSAAERLQAAKALLTDPHLGAEQIGFVFPPADTGGHWRLEMAGGEFCGNASRSFALWAAVQSGLTGRHTITIETSGISQPVAVHVDTEAQSAEIAIPGPLTETTVTLEGRQFPVYVFEGITHIIAENVEANEALARRLIQSAAERHESDAAGVMFYDSGKSFMRPAVRVRATDTLVFESSCGSGSAALGVWAARNQREANTIIELAQPGGVITVHTVKQAGNVTRLSISGTVTLSETMLFRY